MSSASSAVNKKDPKNVTMFVNTRTEQHRVLGLSISSAQPKEELTLRPD
jgi:hypothetical protein